MNPYVTPKHERETKIVRHGVALREFGLVSICFFFMVFAWAMQSRTIKSQQQRIQRYESVERFNETVITDLLREREIYERQP